MLERKGDCLAIRMEYLNETLEERAAMHIEQC